MYVFPRGTRLWMNLLWFWLNCSQLLHYLVIPRINLSGTENMVQHSKKWLALDFSVSKDWQITSPYISMSATIRKKSKKQKFWVDLWDSQAGLVDWGLIPICGHNAPFVSLLFYSASDRGKGIINVMRGDQKHCNLLQCCILIRYR